MLLVLPLLLTGVGTGPGFLLLHEHGHEAAHGHPGDADHADHADHAHAAPAVPVAGGLHGHVLTGAQVDPHGSERPDHPDHSDDFLVERPAWTSASPPSWSGRLASLRWAHDAPGLAGVDAPEPTPQRCRRPVGDPGRDRDTRSGAARVLRASHALLI